MRELRILVCVLALALCGCSPGSSGPSKGPANVLIVVNETSPDSVAVGAYYVQKRGILPKFVCKIQCSGSEQSIGFDAFEKTIRTPIREFVTRNGLKDRIDYIVLTRGIPIRASDWGVDSALTCLFQ